MSATTELSTCAVAVGEPKVTLRQRRVLDVLIANHRHAAHPLTAGEIRDVMERLHSPQRFDYGRITDLLDQLRTKGLVQETGETQFNELTQRHRATWVIPASQARLFA